MGANKDIGGIWLDEADRRYSNNSREQRVRDSITPAPVKPGPSIDLAVGRIIYLEDQTAQLTEQLRMEREQYKQAMRNQPPWPRIAKVIRYGTLESLKMEEIYRDLDGFVVVVR